MDFFVLLPQTLSYQNFLHVAAHAYDVESCRECDFRAVGKRCRCHLAARRIADDHFTAIGSEDAHTALESGDFNAVGSHIGYRALGVEREFHKFRLAGNVAGLDAQRVLSTADATGKNVALVDPRYAPSR